MTEPMGAKAARAAATAAKKEAKVAKTAKPMKARFPSKCKRCGLWILHNELIDWTRGSAATHLTLEQCEQALPSVILPSDPILGSERWERLERVGRLLEAHPYRFAKTMPDVPHCYTLRKEWSADTHAFSRVVTDIHLLGEKRTWYGSKYDYLDVNEYFYWSMEPRTAPPEATTLINRALRKDYPEQNPPEPTWFAQAPMCVLAMLVTAQVGSLVGLDVLDIGCTWPGGAEGARSYLGLGSPGDVHRVAAEHPHVPTLCARVAYFLPREQVRFDVVLALCGAGSHLTPAELERLPQLVAPQGVAALMFGTDQWREGVFPGAVYEYGEHVLVVWRNSDNLSEPRSVSPYRNGWPH
jgi:hypothetical protein